MEGIRSDVVEFLNEFVAQNPVVQIVEGFFFFLLIDLLKVFNILLGFFLPE